MDISLRQIEEGDLPQLRDWRNSDWLRPYVREYRLLNMVDQREWFEHISTARDTEMFGVMVNKKLSGVCGLTNINWVNRTAEVSIYVTPEARGWGVGSSVLEKLETIAFDQYNLHRLWAEVFEHNEAGRNLFEGPGEYVREGRMRQHVFKAGEFHDSLIYGRLRCDR